jgi:hypothetical protein
MKIIFYQASLVFGAAVFFAGLDGLDLPKDPLVILPFFVLISPRPIYYLFLVFK